MKPLHSWLRAAWPPRRNSLRTQLVLWNVLALGILFAALGVIIHYTVLSTIMASVDQQLDTQTRPWIHGDRPPPQNGSPGPPPSADDPLGMLDNPSPNNPNGSPPNGPPPNGPNGPDGSPSDGPPPNGSDGPPPNGPDGPPPDSPSYSASGRPPPNPYHPRRYDLQGRSLETYDTLAPWDRQALALAAQGKAVYTRVVRDAVPLRVYSCPFPDRGAVRGVIQDAYPLTDINRAIAGLNRALLALVPVALLCAGFGGTLLTDRVLRRVRQMSQAAGQISAQNFSERLPVTGQDEFSELAATFNAMLSRLQSAFEQQRRFTADASHELKTPLTIIKGNTSMTLSSHSAEADYRQSLEEIDCAADTMGRLVQDLLLLARSDSGLAGRGRRDVLVQELLTRAVARVPRQASALLQLAAVDETLAVTGNEDELVRLFANLLDNAIRHTPPEGQVTVEACRDGNAAVVTVTDRGPGIASEHLPHLGERFYRVDSARARPDGGTGLGLSICKSIVEAHGGTMTFESQLGVGTTVIVRLPAV